ncbi:DUF4065 domain-containing protein [Leuconostoc lactis]|uniref:Panacea domain-containing protein n=1 Tax=Leuconostoc lactis TaxID=1246 RepID=UPI001D117ECC|nr:type II toxin-antitoxin system antitoxin SocA domain-containing protein [Leuconostoc lactis]MCC2745079.1 DUF4065 domain-containing protein [Leuconostoc lactis]MCC2755616.1 DUF4065 domain-containing protein [Leuconostoc lactis]
MTMNQLAEHIIAVDNNNDVVITNLKLQKVMYFLLKYIIQNNDLKDAEDIYDLPFSVWRYGPVVESIYERYKVFGSTPIVESNEERKEYSQYNDEIIRLSKMDVFELVRQSHEEDFWKQNEFKISGWRSSIFYTLNDVGAEG